MLLSSASSTFWHLSLPRRMTMLMLLVILKRWGWCSSLSVVGSTSLYDSVYICEWKKVLECNRKADGKQIRWNEIDHSSHYWEFINHKQQQVLSFYKLITLDHYYKWTKLWFNCYCQWFTVVDLSIFLSHNLCHLFIYELGCVLMVIVYDILHICLCLEVYALVLWVVLLWFVAHVYVFALGPVSNFLFTVYPDDIVLLYLLYIYCLCLSVLL